MYRQRSSIETSYRKMNHVHARTTPRNPVIRLLFVGLVFILLNLYILLRHQAAICLKKPCRADCQLLADFASPGASACSRCGKPI